MAKMQKIRQKLHKTMKILYCIESFHSNSNVRWLHETKIIIVNKQLENNLIFQSYWSLHLFCFCCHCCNWYCHIFHFPIFFLYVLLVFPPLDKCYFVCTKSTFLFLLICCVFPAATATSVIDIDIFLPHIHWFLYVSCLCCINVFLEI